jgi:hypothetical protein
MPPASTSCIEPIVQAVSYHGLLGIAGTTALGAFVFISTAGIVRLVRLTPTKYRVLVARHYINRVLAVLTILIALIIGLFQLLGPVFSDLCTIA